MPNPDPTSDAAVVYWARRYVAAVDAMRAVHEMLITEGALTGRICSTGSNAMRIRNECMTNLRLALRELDSEKGIANV